MNQVKLTEIKEAPSCVHCYWWTSEVETCSNTYGGCDFTPIDEEWYETLTEFCGIPKDCFEKSTVGRWKWVRSSLPKVKEDA